MQQASTVISDKSCVDPGAICTRSGVRVVPFMITSSFALARV
jgi:hypothetical protein